MWTALDFLFQPPSGNFEADIQTFGQILFATEGASFGRLSERWEGPEFEPYVDLPALFRGRTPAEGWLNFLEQLFANPPSWLKNFPKALQVTSELFHLHFCMILVEWWVVEPERIIPRLLKWFEMSSHRRLAIATVRLWVVYNGFPMPTDVHDAIRRMASWLPIQYDGEVAEYIGILGGLPIDEAKSLLAIIEPKLPPEFDGSHLSVRAFNEQLEQQLAEESSRDEN